MALRIQNNIAAINAQRNLNISNTGLSKSLERLSSGYRINRAADDAAGLAISQQFRADIASFKVASRNSAEANSLLQVAEGALDQMGNILTRLKELATQAASGNSGDNIAKINAEANQLVAEFDRIATSTQYAGKALLTGEIGGGTGDFTADLTGVAGTATASGSAIAGLYEFTATGGEVTRGASVTAGTDITSSIDLIGESALGTYTAVVTGGAYDDDASAVVTPGTGGTITATSDSDAVLVGTYTLTQGGSQTASGDATFTLSYGAATEVITVAVGDLATTTALDFSGFGITLGTAGLTTTTLTTASIAVAHVHDDYTVTMGAQSDTVAYEDVGSAVTLSFSGLFEFDLAADWTVEQLDGMAVTVADTAADATVTLSGTGGTQALTVLGADVGTAYELDFANLGIIVNLDASWTTSGLDDAEITVEEEQSAAMTFQIGSLNQDDNRLTISIDDAQAAAMGLVTDMLETDVKAQAALDTLDTAIGNLGNVRGDIGAYMNRLSYASSNLETTIENVQAAESVIRDVDMAAEMTTFVKNQILMQAGTAMLAQANMVPQSVLSLLG